MDGAEALGAPSIGRGCHSYFGLGGTFPLQNLGTGLHLRPESWQGFLFSCANVSRLWAHSDSNSDSHVSRDHMVTCVGSRPTEYKRTQRTGTWLRVPGGGVMVRVPGPLSGSCVAD